MTDPLFSIPIAPMGAHPGGSIVCTQPRAASPIYVLTWTSPPDNRLTTPFLRALLTALDVLEFGGVKPGVVVTTSGVAKFYSNGLDLEHAFATDGFWELLYSVWARFLTFPMPTVALLNGHTYAGALMLSLAHDYRLAPTPRGFLCLNELLFGAPLKPAMMAVFRHKLPMSTCRTLALEARRLTGPEAVDLSIADALAPTLSAALDFIDAHALLEKPQSGVYGTIKAEMHKDLLVYLQGESARLEEARFDAVQAREAERKEFGKVWYAEWARENKSKL